jgi:hypothetical protein
MRVFKSEDGRQAVGERRERAKAERAERRRLAKRMGPRLTDALAGLSNEL